MQKNNISFDVISNQEPAIEIINVL